MSEAFYKVYMHSDVYKHFMRVYPLSIKFNGTKLYLDNRRACVDDRMPRFRTYDADTPEAKAVIELRRKDAVTRKAVAKETARRRSCII